MKKLVVLIMVRRGGHPRQIAFEIDTGMIDLVMVCYEKHSREVSYDVCLYKCEDKNSSRLKNPKLNRVERKGRKRSGMNISVLGI